MTCLTTVKGILPCLGLCLLVIMCGCKSDQEIAKIAVQEELAARNAARVRSIELCQEGICAYDESDASNAQKYLHEAIAIDDRNAVAWMMIGLIEFEEGRLRESAEAFQRAARLRPTRYEPLFNLGVVFESAGQTILAIEKHERALELAPTQTEVMENLARCYIKTDTNLDKAKNLIATAMNTECRPEWVEWLQRQDRTLKQANEVTNVD